MNDPSPNQPAESRPSPREGEKSDSLFLEYLLADQRQLYQENRAQPVEVYLERYPILREHPEALLDLIYQEILLREQQGQAPNLEEYQQRFPYLSQELQIQFELENALGKTHVAVPRPAKTTDVIETMSVTNSGFGPDEWPVDLEIPGYEILGELGRGGMGIVYKARQTALGRVVALKMLLASGQTNHEHLNRFRIEAEAVARLQHPNIVQIYEVGQHGGQPFFSLEFCPGGTLYDKLQKDILPAREAASLIEILARAIHVAHTVQIIHRDLKPANVLLTLEGTPKITDFGLAKKLDDQGQTQSGAVMGTPSYMAPEQASGQIHEIGPAADVYALGAILYECLTGRPPFKAATIVDTLMQVRTEEPISPKYLNRRTPVDLETICLKCLRKEPARRYPSAGELADDLGRHLRGEPIHARPIPWYEKAVRWTRRHPAATAILSISLLAAVIVLGTWIWSYRELAAMNVELQSARDKAEDRYRIALHSVDEMYVNVMEKWVSQDPHMDDLQRGFLEKALGVYRQLAEDQKDDPKLLESTAHAFFVMGQINVLLGEYAQAEEAYQQAIAFGKQLVQRDSNEPKYRQELANTYNWLGELRRKLSRDQEALQFYDRALEIQSRLVEEYPDRPEYVREKARSLNNRGIIFRSTGKAEPARQMYEEATSLLKPLTWHNQTDPSFAHELARIWINLGNLLAESRNKQDHPLARDAYTRAIGSLEELARRHPRIAIYRFELANAVINLGNLLRGTGSPREARELFTQAVETLTKLQENYPGRLSYQGELANAYNSLAVIEVQEDPELARQHWEEASKRFQRLTEQVPEDMSFQYRAGLAQYNLGLLAQRNIQDRPALEHFERALTYLLHAVSKNADNVQYREQARRVATRIIKRRLELGEDIAAAETIRKYVRAFANSNSDLLEAARLMAGCASAASRNGKPAAERVRGYVTETIELLRRIEPDRLSPIPSLQDDPSFAALIDNEEFQTILKNWAASGSSPGGSRKDR